MNAHAPRPPERARTLRLTSSDLATRLASAGVLASAAGLATYAGLWPFAVLVAVAGAVVAWEWDRLVHGRTSLPLVTVLAATTVAASLLGALGQPLWALGAVALGAVLLTALTPRAGRAGWMALGAVYFGLPALALVVLRADPAYGMVAVFYLFVTVWSADMGAYLIGRRVGGPRLAPSISPQKTWSGFAGGLATPALLVYALTYWFGGTSPLMMAVLTVGFAVIAQAGDLAESAAKRVFRAKDASGLIPGHGGLLDRVDGLIFVAVAAGLVAAARDAAQPGRALLIWP